MNPMKPHFAIFINYLLIPEWSNLTNQVVLQTTQQNVVSFSQRAEGVEGG